MMGAISTPLWHRSLWCLTLAMLSIGFSSASDAKFDYQINGFAAQGFVLSEGNNFFGDSTEGSFKFYEAGLNWRASPMNKLLMSAQVVMRDAGESDNDGLRLDFAFVDYQFLSQEGALAGIRAGRVKNELGFFNDTRDVLFTRPSILLPQSIYFDGQGLRGLLFATNGVQAYGERTFGSHHLSASATWGPDFYASKEDERVIGGGSPLAGRLRISNFFLGRLQDEFDSGAYKFALSYLQADIALIPTPGGSATPAGSETDYFVLSARWNAERFSLTSEYRLANSLTTTSSSSVKSKSDGGYVQTDYRFTPSWTLIGRYDASFLDRNDRDGRRFAANNGGNRASRYAEDLTLGARWDVNRSWGIWGEYHLINGHATAPILDNRGRTLEAQWSLFLLMTAFRF